MTSLAARFGAAGVADPLTCEAFAIGGVTPALVARPRDVVELAAMVAATDGAGGALVALGRGAHRGLGHPPRRYDVALVTDRLARVCDYAPADMTVTVEAGATFADLQGLLAREGQWLPLEPPLPAATTIGGLLASDLGGSLVASQGRVRDFVIGIAVVTAAGVPARAGGRVVKNVAGFDLMKLFIGSLGTLAVVTEATFKVRPRPDQQRTLVFTCGTALAACAFGAALAAARTAVLAVTVLVEIEAGARAVEVVVRLGGVAADVAAAGARLRALAVPHRAEITHDADDTDAAAAPYVARIRDGVRTAAGDLVVRMPTLPSRVAALVADTLATAGGARGSCQCDPLHGGVVLALATNEPTPLLDALGTSAETHGARLIVERWPVALAATIDVWRPLPSGVPLMRRVKAALDPHGTLAPGRFVGRL